MNLREKREILSVLNEEQKLPVQNYKGPQFVIAGPGSGKTHCVIQRTKYMIADGVNPSSILLFTFTNKAAREIKERVAKGVGEQVADKITMGTYHSFCCRILRQYCDNIGFKRSFSIFDKEDSEKILKDITKGSQVDFKLLGSFIEGAKRNLLTPSQVRGAYQDINETMLGMYEQYQQRLKAQNVMDFNDLIFFTVKMFEEFPEIISKINNRYKYVVADEAHDSAKSDLRLIKLLAGESQNICFIADDNQSIYSFRGADLNAFLKTRFDYENLVCYNLGRNYRCSKTIVEASKSLIARNSVQLEKNIFTENKQGDKIILLEEKSPQHEGFRIAKSIELLRNKYGRQYKDIAILYRTGAQAKAIEEAFIKTKIPYVILSGINFFQREEIKDIVSYLKVIINPNNYEAFRRSVNVPKRGIGDATVEKIIEESKQDIYQCNIVEAINSSIDKGLIKGKAKQSLKDYLDLLYRTYCKIEDEGVEEALVSLVAELDYYEYLEKNDKTGEVFELKIENIIELIEISSEYSSIEEFLEQTSLGNNEDTNLEEGKVQMLTMHMSKGLEWPVVFLAGCNEGTIPHFKSVGSSKALEEERRIFYVAMTRAKENLFFTRATTGKQGGFFKPTKCSSFIAEIDDKFIHSSNRKK